MSRIKRIVLGVGVVAACVGAAVTWHGVEDHPFTPLFDPGPERSNAGSHTPSDTLPVPTDPPRRVTESSEPAGSVSLPPPPAETRVQAIESPSVAEPQAERRRVRTPEPPQYDRPVEVVQPVQRSDPELHDPFARFALAYVGADVDAEQYWVNAIFDSTLPDEERDDLMEDLNEVGFSNGKFPGPGDRPLIVNRIAIVEDLLPLADAFMQKHLAEAHKDLVGMLYGKMPQ